MKIGYKLMKKNDEYFLQKAIDLAMEARKLGNEPFGAILVKENQIVMEGRNQINTYTDPTHHAEIGLIRDYCRENKVDDLRSFTLYSSMHLLLRYYLLR
jgi:tRNA(Arg) A34 adenosine deaminase TadA